MSKLHTVLPPASEAKMVGNEPTWEGVFDLTKYNSQVLRGLNWHNYCASDKDHVKYLEAWVKVHRVSTQKNDIAVIKAASSLDPTVCNLARMHLQGFPLNEKHTQHIHDYITSVLHAPKPKKVVAAAQATKPVVSIQDRIKQQVSRTLSDLDATIDAAFDGEEYDGDKLAGEILTQGFKGPQLKLVTDYLKANLAEWQNAYDRTDEQLVQGYSYVKRRQFKQIIDTFTEILEKISAQQTKLKTQRIVKKKPVDKKKLASKLRFMPEFPDLNLKSVNPVDIIGANMVWVYDTKTRRIGVYEGEVKDSLFVRGTKIEGYKMTCSKILRKPEEQLAEFMKLRKNQTMNWLDTIKAKCGELNGRTNANLILLRID